MIIEGIAVKTGEDYKNSKVNIMLSERSQSQMTTYCMILFM